MLSVILKNNILGIGIILCLSIMFCTFNGEGETIHLCMQINRIIANHTQLIDFIVINVTKM